MRTVMKSLIAMTAFTTLALPAVAQPNADPYDLDIGNGLLAACTADAQRERERCMAFLQGYVLGVDASTTINRFILISIRP